VRRRLELIAHVPIEPPRLGRVDGRKETAMAAQVFCFLIGAVAPLAGVGWLLAYH
jgi:hypothetical protein